MRTWRHVLPGVAVYADHYYMGQARWSPELAKWLIYDSYTERFLVVPGTPSQIRRTTMEKMLAVPGDSKKIWRALGVKYGVLNRGLRMEPDA